MKLINNHKILNSRKTQQSGFSLIELLIASTLGLFIMGGVVTSFLGTKDSEQMRSTVSEMDANARTALEILRQNISLAGYSSMRNIQGFDKPFYSESDGVTTNDDCPTGGVTMNSSNGVTPGDDQYTVDSGGSDPNNGRGDVLTTIHLADNPCAFGLASCPDIANVNPKAMVYTDCTGGGATRDARTVSCSTDVNRGFGIDEPLNAKIYSTFYLGSGADNRTLYCQGNRGGAQPLVENIEYLQFLYGVTRADGTTAFLRANTVETNDEWSYVTSVRVGLLMRSSRENLLKTPSNKSRYVLLDRNVKVSDMRRLYRVYTTTINLPNRNRGLVL